MLTLDKNKSQKLKRIWNSFERSHCVSKSLVNCVDTYIFSFLNSWKHCHSYFYKLPTDTPKQTFTFGTKIILLNRNWLVIWLTIKRAKTQVNYFYFRYTKFFKIIKFFRFWIISYEIPFERSTMFSTRRVLQLIFCSLIVNRLFCLFTILVLKETLRHCC